MELFVVPTNRNVKKCVDSLIKESNSINNNCLIMIIDNSSLDIQKQNKRIIEEYHKYTQNILWINLEKQKELIEILANELNYDKNEMMNLLYAEHCDYGKIFNIIYLFVIALGFDSFHRRDSDCFVSGDSNSYPIYMEMKYLNKTIDETDIKEYCPEEYFTNDKIYAVGSDYIGNWNMDFHKLIKMNPKTLNYLYSLSNIPEEYQNEYIETKYLSSDKQFYSRAMFDYEKNFYQWAEMGNISMFEIFKLIPNFIGKNAIGFDYNVYNFTYPFGIPTVYHINKIEHRHDKVRKELNSMKPYWKGIFKLNDYNLIMKEFSENYKFDLNKSGIIQLREGMINGDIVESLTSIVHNLSKEKRYDVMNTITEKIIGINVSAEYLQIREFLKENTEYILNETFNDYMRSLQLIKMWNRLVDICECSSKVKNYIAKMRPENKSQ